MSLRFLTSGESHGPAIMGILEGFPARVQISIESINRELSRRQKGYGAGPRMKIEKDTVSILGGVMAGLSTGGPITVLIENKDHEKWEGKSIASMTVPRPGHADLTGAVKYGYPDLRMTLERASARETVARVAIGAICRNFLSHFGIVVSGYVVEIGGLTANLDDIPHHERGSLAEKNDIRCPDQHAAQKIQQRIQKIIEEKDTLGGVIEVCVIGLPAGLGSHVHWDRKIEARLGAALLGIQAIKGVEFGPAFENAKKRGTEVQDPIKLDGESIIRGSNFAGGIEGGITNGEPLIVRAAMKPIATTLTPQASIDLATGEEVPTQYHRSDFCPVPRAVPILEAVAAIVLADALIEKLGGDSLKEMEPRFHALRKMRLSELPVDDLEMVWWP
ncbi:MAG: chorismate synthase [Chloroflexi bacterium]|nr:chorismate synthase [Chloroflexota bacterium]